MIKNKELLSIFIKNLGLKANEIKDLQNTKFDIMLNVHKKWDSLMHVKIIADIEKKFNLEINEKNFLKFTSIKQINKLINK
tara:strand:+ start:171 stop:413 length:243 start_codon:yes stop_codon:yes gene_type:complete